VPAVEAVGLAKRFGETEALCGVDLSIALSARRFARTNRR